MQDLVTGAQTTEWFIVLRLYKRFYFADCGDLMVLNEGANNKVPAFVYNNISESQRAAIETQPSLCLI